MCLNEDNATATNVTCGAKCFSELGLPATGSFTVLDVWLDRVVATTTPAAGFTVAIPGGGDSRVVIIMQQELNLRRRHVNVTLNAKAEHAHR